MVGRLVLETGAGRGGRVSSSTLPPRSSHTSSCSLSPYRAALSLFVMTFFFVRRRDTLVPPVNDSRA
eukprot:5515284-Prorocentrum_lima.AAC.1